jgi:hypothetical protein
MGVATVTGDAQVPPPSTPASRNEIVETGRRHPQPNLSSSPNIIASATLIDNSRNPYIPIQLGCGVRALCRPDVLTQCPLILKDLNSDLCQCMSILPRSVHHLVLRTDIWLNLSYKFGPRDRPVVLNHSAAHHHEAWLLWCVFIHAADLRYRLPFHFSLYVTPPVRFQGS